MSKLNINITDTKDLITQAKNLTEAQRKEAQIARLYINQGQMPVYKEGVTGRFVMIDNIGFKSKPMSDAAFRMGLAHAGMFVGLKEQDVMETYDGHETIAMALCNHVQKKTMSKYQNYNADQIKEISDRIEKNLEVFGSFARKASVDLGVIMAAEQQTKKDIANMKEFALNKDEDSNEK